MAVEGTTSGPRFPDVRVPLSGQDSNTGAIMGRVTRALERAGHGEYADEFRAAVFDCESYDAVIRLVMRWVQVG